MAVYKLFWDEFSSWYLEIINLLTVKAFRVVSMTVPAFL